MLTNQIIGECNTVELIPLTGPINGESLLKYFATQRRFAVALLFWISFAVVFFPSAFKTQDLTALTTIKVNIYSNYSIFALLSLEISWEKLDMIIRFWDDLRLQNCANVCKGLFKYRRIASAGFGMQDVFCEVNCYSSIWAQCFRPRGTFFCTSSVWLCTELHTKLCSERWTSTNVI